MSFLYDRAKQGYLAGSLTWFSPMRAVLVTADYRAKPTDLSLTSIPPAAILATSDLLDGLEVLGGRAAAGNVWFHDVMGADAAAVVLYADRVIPGMSPLVCYIDSAEGLPFSPDGSPVRVEWPEEVFAL